MARFWVVGGEYTSLGFEALVSGTERVFGPFPTRDHAERVWREQSEEHRWKCTVRFTIAKENLAAPSARA
jgi:hypothetical protein